MTGRHVVELGLPLLVCHPPRLLSFSILGQNGKQHFYTCYEKYFSILDQTNYSPIRFLTLYPPRMRIQHSAGKN